MPPQVVLAPANQPLVTLGALTLPSSRPALPPGLIPQPRVPETYQAGKFGADAMVTFSGKDAEIMNKMAQVSDILQALAMEMNQFAGVMPSTRALIKECRILSTGLQEEIEVRKGPQG